jgi:hypothetical protein
MRCTLVRLCFHRQGQWYGIEHILSTHISIAWPKLIMTAWWPSSSKKKAYLKQPGSFLGIARRKSHSQLICGSRYEYKESFVLEVMTVCVGHWLTRCWYVGFFALAKCFLGLFYIFGEVMADVYYLTSDLVRENPDAQTGIAAITIGWRFVAPVVGRHWRDVGGAC